MIYSIKSYELTQKLKSTWKHTVMWVIYERKLHHACLLWRGDEATSRTKHWRFRMWADVPSECIQLRFLLVLYDRMKQKQKRFLFFHREAKAVLPQDHKEDGNCSSLVTSYISYWVTLRLLNVQTTGFNLKLIVMRFRWNSRMFRSHS